MENMEDRMQSNAASEEFIRIKRRGRRLKVIGIVFGLVGGLGINGAVRGAFGLGVKSSEEVFAIAVVVAFGVTGAFLIRRGVRMMQLRGEEFVQTDPRTPVVYLRSFAADGADEMRAFASAAVMPLQRFVTLEEALGLAFQRLGPVVAVGRPGEILQPQGIPRFYARSEWQPFVRQLVRSAVLVLIRVGNTDGLWWEISEAIQLVKPEKILLVCISSSDLAAYGAFVQRANAVFPKPLPDRLNGASYVWFAQDWTPIPLRVQKNRFWTWIKLSADINVVALKSRAVALATLFEHFGVPPVSATLTRGTCFNLVFAAIGVLFVAGLLVLLFFSLFA